MRKIEQAEAASLGLPTHEQHDLPANKIILDTLQNNPGFWFHAAFEETGAVGTNDAKLQALLSDAEFRAWTLHTHVKPGFFDGGLFLMRDMMDWHTMQSPSPLPRCSPGVCAVRIKYLVDNDSSMRLRQQCIGSAKSPFFCTPCHPALSL